MKWDRSGFFGFPQLIAFLPLPHNHPATPPDVSLALKQLDDCPSYSIVLRSKLRLDMTISSIITRVKY
jgi:hypothetical protein